MAPITESGDFSAECIKKPPPALDTLGGRLLYCVGSGRLSEVSSALLPLPAIFITLILLLVL